MIDRILKILRWVGPGQPDGGPSERRWRERSLGAFTWMMFTFAALMGYHQDANPSLAWLVVTVVIALMALWTAATSHVGLRAARGLDVTEDRYVEAMRRKLGVKLPRCEHCGRAPLPTRPHWHRDGETGVSLVGPEDLGEPEVMQ